MQTGQLKIYRNDSIEHQADSSLSFKPFIQYLKGRLKNETTVKSEFYRFVIDKFEEKKKGNGTISVADSAGFKDLMDMIYLILTPPVTSENEHFWALAAPVSGNIVYSTDRFYKFLTSRTVSEQNRNSKDNNTYSRQQLLFIYRLILQRFYNIPTLLENEIMYTSTDANSRLPRFYRIHADTQFIDIILKGKLPELHYSDLEPFLQDEESVAPLEQLLPLSLFKFEGFAVITLTDVTIQHALERIRSTLILHSEESEQCDSNIFQALKILGGNEDIEFGLLPFLEVNGKAVFINQECSRSMVMGSAQKQGFTEEAFNSLVHEYSDNPRRLVFNNLSEEKQLKHPFLKGLKGEGVYSFAVLPVYYNKQLAGIMEVYSKKEVLLDGQLFSRVQAAMPFIAQMLRHSTEAFNARIKDIIREKFTSLQPSVEWKFNEVAWKYLQQKNAGVKLPKIETVVFQDLYALYGAIDVRNSTTERNKAVHEDMRNQLFLLEKALDSIEKITQLSFAGQLTIQCQHWREEIKKYFETKDEIALHRFFEVEAHPFLNQVSKKFPDVKDVIKKYFDAIAEGSGSAFQNRRELDASLQLINTELNHYLETAQQELQQVYPVYFEKFRTDGIEYDIYTGQSIAPEKHFDISIIKEMRKWQLRSMAGIANLMQDLLPRMPRPLQTTQLIFIHPDPIDVNFRNDERRFDVEGAYNIRYEVIKKRIDKVHINDTQDRLTQPGKIAMVYFNDAEEEEYAGYIRELQEEGLFEDDLEYLELEELQGVTGLKALRVGVKN